jgi:hypothetical protein
MVQKPCRVEAIAVKPLVGRNSAAYGAAMQRSVRQDGWMTLLTSVPIRRQKTAVPPSAAPAHSL